MALIGIVLLSVFSTFSVEALLNECPPLESTSCSCAIKWGPAVTCSKINDVKTLTSTLQKLEGYAIDLELSQLNLPKLEKDTFKTLHIKTLTLDNFEVGSSDIIKFQGLDKTMKILQIENSFKTKPLSNLKLDNLENLEAVMMADNNINEINNDWFAHGSKQLFSILLERNGIKTLGDRVFESLDGLQILWLTGNSFNRISRSMFPSNAKVLEKIDLSNNKIKEIPNGLFSEMPELLYVNLARNLLHTFVEDKSILKNTRIHLDGNPLNCDSKLGWICKNEVSLDINTAKCDSPNSMKEYTLKVFCDINGKS